MKVYARTDIGNTRALNEDSYYIPDQGERFCAVADGMGGHNAGEVASAMAIDVFAREMRDKATGEDMCRAVERANERIYEASLRKASLSGMGTTFTALLFEKGRASIAHVGDSRVYLLRRGTIRQLTTDHSLVEEMVREGLITRSAAKHHPRRNIITRALGTYPEVEVDLVEIGLQPGDVFLLCTDGFSNCLENSEILTGCTGDWQRDLESLVALALQNGGSDNITAEFAVCEEDDL